MSIEGCDLCGATEVGSCISRGECHERALVRMRSLEAKLAELNDLATVRVHDYSATMGYVRVPRPKLEGVIREFMRRGLYLDLIPIEPVIASGADTLPEWYGPDH